MLFSCTYMATVGFKGLMTLQQHVQYICCVIHYCYVLYVIVYILICYHLLLFTESSACFRQLNYVSDLI